MKKKKEIIKKREKKKEKKKKKKGRREKEVLSLHPVKIPCKALEGFILSSITFTERHVLNLFSCS